MKTQPTLKTIRLTLRPFSLQDCSRVQELAGNKKIADVTANIPYPYPDGLAEEWISSHAVKWNNGELAAFAIELREAQLLIGCISLMNISKTEAELGYWLGEDYWNNGFCTEACREIMAFGFDRLGLQRVHAHRLTRNSASGKVLTKSGLSHIGSGTSVCGYRSQEECIELYEKKIV